MLPGCYKVVFRQLVRLTVVILIRRSLRSTQGSSAGNESDG